MSAYREQEVKRELGNLNFSKVQALIAEAVEEVGEEIVDRLVDDVQHTGCLIAPHRPAEGVLKRDSFRAQLKEYVERNGSKPAVIRLNTHFDEAALTERAFDEILSTLRACSFNTLSLPEQVWACIDRVAGEIEELHRQVGKRAFFNNAVTQDGDVVADAALFSTGNIDGQSADADAFLTGVVSALGSFMQMLSYRHRWFDAAGIIKVPERVKTDAVMQFQIGSVFPLSAAWASLDHASERIRFENGTLTNAEKTFRSTSGETRQIETLVFEHKHEFELVESVARLRQRHLLLQNVMKFENATLRPEQIRNPRNEIVPLPPKAYISRAECLSVLIMEFSYRFPVLSSSALFGELTLSQWLRGYAVLQNIFARDDQGQISCQALRLDKETLLHTLGQSGFSQTQARSFLHHCTFRKGKTDLFDAPIVMDASGQLYLMAFALRSAALWEIVQSQIASQDLQIDQKGTIFEREVRELFESHGIPAHQLQFRLRDTNYECDLAVLWARHLFLFECKNYRLPRWAGRDSYHFWQKLNSAVNQIRRIGDDLAANPEVLRGYFGTAAEWDHTHLCVLNAMPFSLPQPYEDVYFYGNSSGG